MSNQCRHGMPLDQNCGKCICSGIDPRLGHPEHVEVGGVSIGARAELALKTLNSGPIIDLSDNPKAVEIGGISQHTAKRSGAYPGYVSVEDQLRKALSDLLERYTGLVNCGDCGNWDCETEDEVIAARALLDE